MVVYPKCRGLGTQPPAADKVLAFKNVKFYVAVYVCLFKLDHSR